MNDKRLAVISILLACLAYASFNICDAALKSLAGKFHYSQIVVFNSVFNIIVLSAYGAWKDGKRLLASKAWGWVAARAVFLQGIGLAEIFALPHIPLTTFYTLVFTSPFIVALLSSVLLKEKLELRRFAIILAGFCVVIFVFRPGGGLLNIWVPVTLLSALCYSLHLVATRHVEKKWGDESMCGMFIAAAIAGLLWAAPLLPGHYIAPTLSEWALFGVWAIFWMGGFIGISHAFKIAPAAAAVAPSHYTQIVWGALIGWLVFNETPDIRVILGAAALIGLGLYLIWSEARAQPRKTD